MDAETNTFEGIADSVRKIETQEAAKGFILTVISQFQEKYTIEDPDRVKEVVAPVVHALQGLQKRGFDMQPYAKRVVADAAAEFERYSGEKDTLAYKSTLIVADHILHKRGTGYWKK